MRYLIVCSVLIVILCSYVVCEEENEETEEIGEEAKVGDGVVEGRLKRRGALLKRLIPLIAMPFIFQVTMLPAMMLSLKFMLVKGMFLGKLAIIFGLLSLARSFLSKGGGGLYSHNINLHDDYKRRTIIPTDEPAVQEDYDNVGDYAISRIRNKFKTKTVPPFSYL